MESLTAHMTLAKVVCLFLLSILASACGLAVKNDEADARGNGNNRLVAMTDGAYSMQITTTGTVCRQLFDGDLKQMEYVHQGAEGDPDRGLSLTLTVAGDLATGDALVAANSTHERYFDLRMVAPSGVNYAYQSVGVLSSAPDHAELTVIKATKFEFAARLWIEGWHPNGDRALAPASFRGTFECGRWEGSSSDDEDDDE